MVKRFYDTQARTYEVTRRPFLWGRKKVIEELVIRKGETAVEFGCGTGWNLKFLLRKVGATGRVVGIDVSEGMLLEAKKRAFPSNVDLLFQDATDHICVGRKANVVLFSYSITCMRDYRRALENAIMVLAEQGRIGIVDFCTNPAHPFLSRLLLAHGMKYTCDFSISPLGYLEDNGFVVELKKQFFGFGYRAVATKQPSLLPPSPSPQPFPAIPSS